MQDHFVPPPPIRIKPVCEGCPTCYDELSDIVKWIKRGVIGFSVFGISLGILGLVALYRVLA